MDQRFGGFLDEVQAFFDAPSGSPEEVQHLQAITKYCEEVTADDTRKKEAELASGVLSTIVFAMLLEG